jgi:hypothetical protein
MSEIQETREEQAERIARLKQERKDELARRFENKTEHLNKELNYGCDPWRAPKPQEGDTVLFSECGRILDCDYRSHWFMLVKPEFGRYTLLVHHGGGQERITIDYNKRVVNILETLDTHQRYLMLHLLFNVHKDARREASEETAMELKTAFVEGRLKKRKVRGQSKYKVSVEPQIIRKSA